jgi:pyruvate ferredoxin oxidoreductase gamma subunit/2-oxoisovalerate ferredoxin oxidoreductase gamma subunit
LIEMRIHGRGGQGAVTSSKIAGVAVSLEGKYVQALPFYGFERRGAPVQVFLRLDEEPIFIASRIYEPDGILVLDPVLASTPEVVASGMKDNGFAILNTTKSFDELYEAYSNAGINVSKLGKVDATGIALKTIGAPITNTAILGAFCKMTGFLKLDFLFDGIKQVLPPRFHQSNVAACQMSYDQTDIKEF